MPGHSPFLLRAAWQDGDRESKHDRGSTESRELQGLRRHARLCLVSQDKPDLPG